MYLFSRLQKLAKKIQNSLISIFLPRKLFFFHFRLIYFLPYTLPNNIDGMTYTFICKTSRVIKLQRVTPSKYHLRLTPSIPNTAYRSRGADEKAPIAGKHHWQISWLAGSDRNAILEIFIFKIFITTKLFTRFTSGLFFPLRIACLKTVVKKI